MYEEKSSRNKSGKNMHLESSSKCWYLSSVLVNNW